MLVKLWILSSIISTFYCLYQLDGDHHQRQRRDYHKNDYSDFHHTNKVENSTVIDKHKYYTTSYYPNGKQYFIDLTQNLTTFHVEKSKTLSVQYLTATQLSLGFEFPFYGHRVNSVYVTTGGFLSVSPQFHSFIHVVHYIAPLMANFNPKSDNQSGVYYGRSNDVFIVQWNDMKVNATNSTGTFTFQVLLFKNGTILMVFKNIPYSPKGIVDKRHRVTSGLADGFIISYIRHDPILSKKTLHNYIYKYDQIQYNLSRIISDSAVRFEPLKNCIEFTTCESCTQSQTTFDCKWCSALNMCSDSVSWHRQKWLGAKCNIHAFSSIKKCPAVVPKSEAKYETSIHGTPVSAIIVILAVTVLFLSVFSWILYAYCYPRSRSGRWLIEHRPRTWFRQKYNNTSNEDDQDEELI